METTTDMLMELLRMVVYVVAMIGFGAFNAAYLSLLERKQASWIQLRRGPTEVGPYGILQPVADGLKLLSKQILAPGDADLFFFYLAPIMIVVPGIVCLVTIPFSETLAARNINLGLLLIFAFGTINVLMLMFAGWASNNKYASIAAARVVSQNIAYEIPILLIVIAIVMTARSFNLHEIVVGQCGGFWHWNVFNFKANPMMPIAFIIFFTCTLAETNRAPFDMVEAESELIAGSFTEYSGMGFGLFFIAEYVNILVGCCLATVLFLGGWDCPFGIFPGVHWFLLKMYLLCFTVIWVRWTFPRTQFYGLLNLSWKILIPVSLINLLVTAVMLKIFR